MYLSTQTGKKKEKNKKYTGRSKKNFIVFIDGKCYNRKQSYAVNGFPKENGQLREDDDTGNMMKVWGRNVAMIEESEDGNQI